ncbi:hypothetical protein [Xanthomonas campestris]|uniref:hypothetical protein n=1 Tax=Xanthomonas campestris TaxID=339 RepID=UPI0012908A55|nr:hypothetical protein [Xanthomonas campestris]
MDKPLFFRKRIAIGTAVLALFVAAIAWRSMSTGSTFPSAVAPTLLVAAMLVVKWAAPRIPWIEIALCAALILVVHTVAHLSQWIPATWLADKVIELFCLLGFGAYWVAKGYIPASANQ